MVDTWEKCLEVFFFAEAFITLDFFIWPTSFFVQACNFNYLVDTWEKWTKVLINFSFHTWVNHHKERTKLTLDYDSDTYWCFYEYFLFCNAWTIIHIIWISRLTFLFDPHRFLFKHVILIIWSTHFFAQSFNTWLFYLTHVVFCSSM